MLRAGSPSPSKEKIERQQQQQHFVVMPPQHQQQPVDQFGYPLPLAQQAYMEGHGTAYYYSQFPGYVDPAPAVHMMGGFHSVPMVPPTLHQQQQQVAVSVEYQSPPPADAGTQYPGYYDLNGQYHFYSVDELTQMQ
ncbi:hypothetical protein HDU82_001445 [Entophlyctis luteolus]|nr:hypothetical protein HDU82_001445 [Entophlyctis luteolus]